MKLRLLSLDLLYCETKKSMKAYNPPQQVAAAAMLMLEHSRAAFDMEKSPLLLEQMELERQR